MSVLGYAHLLVAKATGLPPLTTFAVWSGGTANAVLSNGNLTVTLGNFSRCGNATIGKTSGKWYWEITFNTVLSVAEVGIGTTLNKNAYLGNGLSGNSNAWGYTSGGQLYNAGGANTFGSSFTNNDVVSVCLDADNGAVYFALNGTLQNKPGDPTPNPLSGAAKTGAAITFSTGAIIYPAWGFFDGASGRVLTGNFGATAFSASTSSLRATLTGNYNMGMGT